MNPKQFVFNPPPATMYPDYFYSSDPTIILKETHTTITIIKPDKKQKEKQKLGSRNKTQCNAINGRQPRDDNELFGNDLSWAYRQYIVHTLLDSVEAGGQSSSPTDRPVQPVSSRSFQPVAKGSDTTRRPYLYLFNVIVALEWIPKPETLRRLEWAFRRASDFLYDVTNGCMAFGQVVFADVDWMDCADIQIMASNRFLPRSWVSGLLDPTKYTPIRVGRGVWVRNRQIEVPWDEPEGYRALVHEWGHYALGMKDEYISTIDVVDDNGIPIEPRTNIVVPLRRIVSESIMATIQGNSEFEPFCTKKYALNINSNTIENYYPGLKKQIKNPNPGPGRLPLPLPQFRYAGQIGDKTRQNERTVKLPFSRPGQLQNGIRSTTFIPRDKDGFPEEGWMVYLIRAGLDNPTRIIPQGEIDARAPKDGFRLLGAEDGDTIVLIGLHDGKTTVRTGQLAGNGDEINWAPVPTVLGNESSDFQLVDVVPEQTDKTSPLSVIVRLQGKQRATVVIKALRSQEKAYGGASERVSIPPTTTPPTTTTSGEAIEAVVFSLDGLPRKAAEEGQPKVSLSTLDGYILTGKDGNWMISDFSKGGPPNSAPNVVSDFIAAGAASGDAVLFFNEKTPDKVEPADKYDKIHVVVTTLRGVELPSDYKAVSPVFSIASTEALPPDTDPTLLIVTPLDTADTTCLCICRLTDGKLDELPTFFSKGPTFAATPLKSGGGTLLEGGNGPHVERYVLATVPSRRLKSLTKTTGR